MALSIVEASQKLARHLTLASSIPKHATSNSFLDSEPPQPPTIISKHIGMSEIGGYLQNRNCSPFSTSLQGVVTDMTYPYYHISSILSHIIHVRYSPFFCYPTTITTSFGPPATSLPVAILAPVAVPPRPRRRRPHGFVADATAAAPADAEPLARCHGASLPWPDAEPMIPMAAAA